MKHELGIAAAVLILILVLVAADRLDMHADHIYPVVRRDGIFISRKQVLAEEKTGKVPEWPIGAVLKTAGREIAPWVQIPPLPPILWVR